MSTNLPFQRADTFSDDAHTLRMKSSEGKLIGIIDFPSFQRAGKMINASSISPRPLNEAVVAAKKILPHTPFPEIVILFQHEFQQAAD